MNIKMNTVTVDKIKIGAGHPLVLIAGPCVIESEEVCQLTQTEICPEIGCRVSPAARFEDHEGLELTIESFCGSVIWIQVGTEDT